MAVQFLAGHRGLREQLDLEKGQRCPGAILNHFNYVLIYLEAHILYRNYKAAGLEKFHPSEKLSCPDTVPDLMSR